MSQNHEPEFLPTEEKNEKGTVKLQSMLLDWAEVFLQSLVIIILIFMFVGRNSSVSGSSMVPTLHDKDMLIISSFRYEPKQGDIVVFINEAYRPEALVKRVIGLAGDKVEVDYDTNSVMVNGDILPEPYLGEEMFGSGIFSVTVPEGHVFVLGDNRNNSSDGRVFGTIDKRLILGKALFRLFPFNGIGTV